MKIIDIFDIIYFIAGAFMLAILFAGIDETFAIITGFIIFVLWFKIKKVVN